MKTYATMALALLLFPVVTLFGQNGMTPRGDAASGTSGFLPFPKEISYQGLLTTSSGAPAADGSYTLRFDLYNVLGGGVSLWTETQIGVPVSNGVFSVRLGSVTPPPEIFSQLLYLEVAALAGPGISGTVTFTPRTQLAASAFSLAPWQSQGYDLYFPYGNVSIGTATPNPQARLAVEGHGAYAGRFTSDSLSTYVNVLEGRSTATGAQDVKGVYGGSIPLDYYGIGGQFIGGWRGVDGYVFPTGMATYTGVAGTVFGGGGTNRGIAAFANGGAQNYALFAATEDSAAHYAGYFSGRLAVASVSGDSSTMLPDDAVSAAEMLNEPGLASHHPFTFTPLTAGTTSATDSVTITIPADGYVVVQAGGFFNISHTTGTPSNLWTDVSQTRGATPGSAYQWGYVNSALPSGLYGQNFHNHRVFALGVGTYEFFLNAYWVSGTSNSVGAHWMQATYYPTSYGPVTTVVPAADGGAGTGIDSPSSLDVNPAGRLQIEAPETDLRDLELAALRARAQAQEAERKLLEAQLAKEKEKGRMPEQR